MGLFKVTTKKHPRIRLPGIPVVVFPGKKEWRQVLANRPCRRKEKAFMDKSRDQDRGKGATEQAPQNEGEGGNTSMQGQLGHRDNNAELKNADSDFSG